MLRIAIISDIHHCPEKNKNLKEQLEIFIKKAQELNVDLIVDLGDRISNVSKEADINNLKVIAKLFKQTNILRHHILGNHDVKNLNVNETEKILDSPINMHNFLIKGYNLIFWNASAAMDFDKGFTELKEKEINYLSKILKDSSTPCIIFSHVPLDDDDIRGNFYFEVKPHLAHYPKEQAQRILDIIVDSKAIMCINGHTHWQCFNKKSKINFITCPSFVETFDETKSPRGIFGLLEIEGKKANLKIIGTNNATFSKINMEIK